MKPGYIVEDYVLRRSAPIGEVYAVNWTALNEYGHVDGRNIKYVEEDRIVAVFKIKWK